MRSLPTKDDIQTMVINLEEAHRRELMEVQGALGTLTTRVEFTEVISAAVEARLGWLEQAQVDAEERMTEMRLLLEGQEVKGRRHNLSIRGVSEVEEPEK